jgi:hypothetical protein
MSVLMTGGFGDHLYDAGVEWLADLLAEGRFLEAGQEMGLYLRYAGLRWLWRAGYLQHVARRWRDALPITRRIKSGRAEAPWMTDFSNQQVADALSGAKQDLVPHAGMVGLTTAFSSSGEVFHASRHAVELRHPYRDRRLVEYVLALPADQLYYHNINKRILRSAMIGILPESVRIRQKPTSIQALFVRGVRNEKDRIESILQNAGETINRFVRSDWLMRHKDLSGASDLDDSNASVIWTCISYLKWIAHPYYDLAV